MLVTQNSAKDFSVFFDAAGLTISHVYLSKNAGVQVDVVGGVTISDRGNGQYRIAPANSHVDTLGEALFIVVDSTGESRPKVIQVVAWEVETGGIDVQSWDGTVVSNAGGLPSVSVGRIQDTVVTEIQSGLATASALTTVGTNVSTILARIPSALFSGITSLANWLGALAGKTADTTTRAEINATTAGATYNETTDSGEAIRDRGDAAWTGGGGNTFNYTVQVSPGINSGSYNCDATDRTKHNLEARKGDTKTFAIPVYESDKVTPFDFTGMTLRVVIEGKTSATDRQVIEDGDITVSDNLVTFTTANTISGKSETLKWALQRITTSPAAKEDILFGDYYVREGCAKD